MQAIACECVKSCHVSFRRQYTSRQRSKKERFLHYYPRETLAIKPTDGLKEGQPHLLCVGVGVVYFFETLPGVLLAGVARLELFLWLLWVRGALVLRLKFRSQGHHPILQSHRHAKDPDLTPDPPLHHHHCPQPYAF
ncbi:hypothetical protein L873DRAFT_245615 [Choiromyces venosus 120613-1]|uniref:Uncharacterized protein n=1 Tax=Choiromyces venosus 120613-1 TaxID=1336337 RepID=A0A3N4J0Z0_9PEZI|nr:hypothetical protein L873DRAFT_245615 [Choiromyces venosus 120613-1]